MVDFGPNSSIGPYRGAWGMQTAKYPRNNGVFDLLSDSLLATIAQVRWALKMSKLGGLSTSAQGR